MIPEEFKKPLEQIDMYDCPIHLQLGEMKMLIQEEQNRQIFKAVREMGIEIDQEGLIEAINADRKRYNAAYTQGWEDCKKYYQERLNDIAALASKEVRPE